MSTYKAYMPLQPCSGCGRGVNPTDPYVLHEVTGWVQRRRGGGIHDIKFRTETGRFMCERCQKRRRETGNEQQGSLL